MPETYEWPINLFSRVVAAIMGTYGCEAYSLSLERFMDLRENPFQSISQVLSRLFRFTSEYQVLDVDMVILQVNCW